MYQVRKRNGDSVIFDLSKIQTALTKSFESCNRNYQDVIVEKLAMKAVAKAEQKIKDNLLSVEDIQDAVESVLMSYGYEDVAKAYILYRKQHENVRNTKTTLLDYKKTVEGYTDRLDWRVKENSTVTYSLGGFILGNSGAITANYWLSEIYDEEIANAHRNCDLHLHDLSILGPYCAGWSLKQLIKEGLGGVPGKITSAPAKHLSTLCNQMVNFLGILQNEWAGAQAFSSVDTYLAPFVKADDLSYKEVKQCMQSLVFGLNTPSRWGSQAPFTNFTFDWVVPDDLAELNCIVGGKEVDFKYKDCKREMDMINRAFIETMIDGDAAGRGHQYPIPTYSITKDFDWDEDAPNNKILFEMTAKYGIPYFSNYINSDMKPSDIRSMAILGTQNVIYKDKHGRISKNEIRHLVSQWLKNPETEYSILMNGKFIDIIDMFEVPYEKYDIYVRVNMKNGQTQSFSYDHKCVVVRNGELIEVLSQDIKDGDSFVLARHGYDESDIGTYEAGKIVGYYLAEGWKSHNGAEIDFAININRTDICDEIASFFKNNFGCRVSIDVHSDKNCNNVKVFGRDACAFVSKFISGDRAIEKRISCACYDTSLAFRSGIYDGYLDTDGSAKSNIFAHTTNKQLCFDMIDLFATIGKYFRYQENKNNTRYFKADKSDLVHFSSYKLIPYVPEVFDENYYIVGISSIDSIDAKRINKVYNFTVNTADHLYELPNGVITHQCCRLRLDLRELRRKNGGYFGSGESTGSIGVVTINMPRLAYKSNSETEFIKKLDKLMDIAARSLHIKRKVVTQLLEQGMYPYTKRYLGSFDNHFSTIGLLGMNEACLNASWLQCKISDDAGYEFSKRVLDHMRERLSDYQEMYPGELFNLESTPAESTTYRFAKHDKEDYPDIITAGDSTDGAPYYTNSSHLPVGYTDDIFTALDHQDDLQTKYTSGTVFHAFLGEKLPNWESAMMLTKKIAENYKLPYFTFSPTYSICPDHGYIRGEEWTCPECGKKTEVYSRVTGYYRAVQNFNDGKAHEFKDRKEYKVGDLTASEDSCDACSTGYTELPEQSIEEDTETAVRKILAPTRKPMLFTTATCPNCKMAKRFISEAGFDCDILLAEENAELVNLYKVSQAPTLIVFNDGEPQTISNVSNIRKYLESIK